MQPFLYAAARGDSATECLDNCLTRLAEIPESANLGFLYATDALAPDLQHLLVRLKTHAPHVDWVGSLGVGLCSTAQEYYEEPALVLMIGSFPPDSYRLLSGLRNEPADLDQPLIDWWQNQAACFALLHGDPTNDKIPSLLGKLADQAYSTFLNGGLTSSASDNYQIVNRVVSGEVSGVLFNEQVTVLTDHTQGCTPIGPVHRLTDAHRNVAFRLDNRPALEVLKEDVGEVLARNLTQSAGYIFTALPIPGSDTGDYLVRNLIGIDEENGLVAVGDYLEGQSQLMFCRRDGNSAREDMLRMLQRLKSRLGKRPIRGGIYISCLGRGRYQFGPESEELKLIESELGNFPLVGFFANGEIYNGRLYGYTGVLTLFV
jgi:small ligand-binding sensory domain FIST